MLLPNLDLLATAPEGVARMRELILTLAVQGKLVPQDASDEPASELLKKIRAEKDRLIADGKIKRDKPLAEIAEDEKTVELPTTWEWVRFGEILDFQGGGQPPKSNFSDVPLPDYVQLIQIRDLGDKPQPVYIPRSLGAKFCTSADVMVGRYGASVGKVFWGKDGAYNVALVKMVDAHRAFDVKFLYQLLVSPVGQGLFVGISRSAQDGFNKNDIEPKLIPLPPLAEQSRIVTRVEELMRLCDALEAKARLESTQHAQLVATLLATLTASATPEELAANWHRVATHFDLLLDRPEAVDALEQTILQLAVRGLLVPQDPTDEPVSELLKKIRTEKDRLITEGKIKRDKPLPPIAEDEKPFELPPGWEWVRMGSLGAAFDYGTSQKSVDDPSAIPVLRMGNIQGGRVVMTNLKYLVDREGDLPALLLQKDDLLFNRTNSYDLVGKTGLFEGFHREVTFASYLIRIKLMNGLVGPQYVDMYMNTRDCRVNEIEPDLTQQTGQANYNGTKLKSIRIPLPPLAEQSRIVARVTSLRALCADLRQRLTAARDTQAQLSEALVAEVN